MNTHSKWPLIPVVGLLIAAAAFAFTGSDEAPLAFSGTVPAGSDSIPNLVGTWIGTWQDTINTWAYGDLSWEINQNGSDFSASGVINFSVFGMGLVAGTASGTITREMLEFTFEAPASGSGSGTITDGAVAGSGSLTMPAFGPFTFEGTLSDTTIRGTFDFAGGGAGEAVLTRETPVEPASWGQVKWRFRESGE